MKITVETEKTKCLSRNFARAKNLNGERKRNLHLWARVGQAGRPLPPRTLSILEGLTLKLVSLYDYN